MAFHEIEFPRGISYGSNFGPSYSTDVVTMPNGAEQRNVNWEYPRHSGNLTTGIRGEADFTELLNFFIARKGKAYGFRFYDWLDHEGKYQYLGMADGSTTTYQLRKYYFDASYSGSVRKIIKPIANTVSVYLYPMQIGDEDLTDFELQEVISNYFAVNTPIAETVSVDTATGVATFATPPASGFAVCASFEFDVPVRFDTDSMSASYESFKAYGWTDIPVIELKL